MTQRKLIRVFRPLTSFMQEMAREYLERTLISTKGLVERAKERLDRLCTFRTMMPQYFNVSNVKEEFTPFTKFLLTSYFRNLTPNHYRVFLNKVVTDVNLESSILTAFYKYMIMVSEYLKNADYCNGFVLIFDYSDANILNLVSKFNPMELKQVTALFTEGYGLRIKGVHIISASRMVETILGLFKQVFSAKVAGRIHIHKTMETVFEFVPKKIFPADYGGDEKYLKDLQAEWFDVLSSKEYMDYYLKMKEAKTDESYREVNEFNEDYIGIPGSFRALNWHPNTVEYVRKEINLDNPERLKESIDILETWLKKQNHFIKKDFPRIYLESVLVLAKGSLERAKERLDKQFTYKTIMPEFFPYPVTKEHFAPIDRVTVRAHLPKLTKQHHRVFLNKLLSDDITHNELLIYYQYAILMCEYLRLHDYYNGIVFVLDIRNINIFNLLTKLNPILFKNFFQLAVEGYGTRVKRLDIISESKTVGSLVSFLKQIFNAKMSNRIYTHKNLDTLYNIIEKDNMPEDYGGKEMSLKKLNDKWMSIVFSKENIDFLNKMKDAKTDESCRRVDKFNEHYVGMAGSFRNLTVD